MREVILYLAVSLDGYLADPAGGVAWLDEQVADREDRSGYDRFIAGIDTVVMGYRTYHQVAKELSPEAWPYAELETYVLTHREDLPGEDGITFVNAPPQELLRNLKEKPGKNIWICGGGEVARQLIELNQIDEYQITVLPILLGDGIPLFVRGSAAIPLKLVSCRPENGAAECIFRRR